MTSPLPDLALPVIAAPMAGGPGTPAFVVAAGRAGGMGFVAGGYQPPEAFAAELATVTAAGVPFGVNLFAPNTVPVDPAAYRGYAALLAPEAARFGVALPPDPVEDDDAWRDKLDVLRQWPVPLVSFTFGLPPPADLALLRATGAVLAQTVTSVVEARAAADAGLDVLVVQAAAGGGHSGTFTPDRPVPVVPLPSLVAEIRAAVSLPVIAAGGVGTAADVAAALGAGAALVAVGTSLLRATEAGTSDTHRAALADPARTTTVVTRAFTGRPARGLRNEFTDRYSPLAPAGYPALHTLTRPIRRAAAATGDPERLHLWAGTGFRHATDDPVATILTRLAAEA
ncbi:NAD(P)H-dependent flavin oxidoreductase YrpB, nitropropane dioxygenase family [Asanoa hainanensis]|uniref:Propionate 3-nitronate monooxygenase n=1 Tax=Asanoa hainanensis TaxID=560556 RepID=A0A239GRZ3_9ACTN|nr:nitronate monooxygenase [Asanoa hainanensis]SNS71548.1 NAD(P)H-dependent flavin oxidoreductase YrpB, nitropropane dioxygenase family [Asanoa hainanensis]